jgi:N-acetylglucosaminyldiphosphoundecaprenol N-acetyl-beta-D-mannosaminyltransferase
MTAAFTNSVLPKALIEQRANVLGVGIHAVDPARSRDVIESAVRLGTRGYVCVTGVHGVMEAQRDPAFRDILNKALLVVPDGMPTVWVGRMQGHSRMKRVFGPDLMIDLCRQSQASGLTHFLYGGKPGVCEQLAENLQEWFPGIRIVGCDSPPFRALSAEERLSLESTVKRLRPDLFWVGLSTPKQERFMAENVGRLACGVMIGVGAAFDFHTGQLRDAPQWIKSSGLQWAHRLCQEPGRLWKRYLVNNSTFLSNIALQMAGLRQYVLDSPSQPQDTT